MVKHSPFQSELFSVPPLEKQVAKIKEEEEQKKSASSKIESDLTLQETELFSKIKELELRVDELEKTAEQRRGWFRF